MSSNLCDYATWSEGGDWWTAGLVMKLGCTMSNYISLALHSLWHLVSHALFAEGSKRCLELSKFHVH